MAQREIINTDVLIIGAGPAGLSAAIAIKRQAKKDNQDIEVIIVEKSAEVGGHIISGAILNPIGLDELIPNWDKLNAPVKTKVRKNNLYFLGNTYALKIPEFLLPPQMKSKNSYLISLGELCVWLGEQATELGVEIYTSTPATDFIIDDDGAIAGIITGDIGLDKDGKQKEDYYQGIELKAKYTIFSEGARGSLSKKLIKHFDLDKNSNPQKYALGIKEIWQVKKENHQIGLVEHFMGFPLGKNANGGGFLYHAKDEKIYLGLVTHLNYQNPTLSPFEEFSRFKTHSKIAKILDGATRISYGARSLTSGGLQSIPKLSFKGGALIGASAGFMNLPALKEIHSAMRSGRIAGEEIFNALKTGIYNEELSDLDKKILASGIKNELKPVQNTKVFLTRFGTLVGTIFSGIDLWANAILKFSPFGVLHHKQADFASTKPIDKIISYKKANEKTTFTRSSSLTLANISFEEDQPINLQLNDKTIPLEQNLPKFGEPSLFYCPAATYEIIELNGSKQYKINAANCLHCKACDIKDPSQNITWTPPEGGSGPNYSQM